jgi:hypothetical protein
MPEPTPKEWGDAYNYCSLDSLFKDNPNHRQAVIGYIKPILGIDEGDVVQDDEKNDINDMAIDFAAKWSRIEKLKNKVDGFKNLAMDRLPLIGKSTCLGGVSDSKGFSDAVNALKGTLQLMSFHVSRGPTQNAGGTVTIGLSVLEDPTKDAEEAVLFALAHELGHTADLTLNPYNPTDTKYPAVHNALMPQLATTTSKNQKLEYFADSFATVLLVTALGISRDKVPESAQFLFKSEAGGGDHPSGTSRVAKVRETLDSKC